MQMLGGILGMYDEPVDLGCVEMKHTCFAMIDPNHRVVVMVSWHVRPSDSDGLELTT